ncbi:MAG: sigma-E factor regulatory protein RseB domain-containing protein [Armatimonadota bacterium]
MRGWMKVLGGVALVVAVLLIVGLILRYTGEPGEDATALVQQAARALDEVAVQGTVKTIVRTPDGRVETRARMHRGDGRFRMRLLSGPGEGSEVFRQGDAVWVEREGAERVRRASVGEHALRNELLERNWEFRTAGTRRIAGRRVTLVRGEGRGGSINLAIDQETGFPLHISRRDRQGKTISETTWVDADFSVQPPPKAEPPPAPRDERRRRAVSLEEAREAVSFTVLEPGWLPEGWELQGWYLLDREIGMMLQARFSDGLRSMMIIQLDAEGIRDMMRGRVQQRRERMEGEGGPRSGETRRRPRDDRQGPPQPRREMRERIQRHGSMHMRGAGADASRRVIDGTLVVVTGPIGDDTRERVLASMAGE